MRSIPETVGPDLRFDWVLASHVIEHVPDVIGWLDQIASITVDGGALMLVVPDRRYCFDAHRPGTSVGQLLEAHELGAVAPSVRAVFDHHRSAVRVRPQDLWAGRPVTYDKRVHDLDYALDRTAAARAGEYVDCHVWLFTPEQPARAAGRAAHSRAESVGGRHDQSDQSRPPGVLRPAASPAEVRVG